MPIVKVSASARIPTTLDLSQIESILASVDRESPQGKRDYSQHNFFLRIKGIMLSST
jgi:hypothetical protein